MSYRTTCPQCSSVFRLGPDQLDAAQGWVQCGVCGAAFDARASLLMEDGSPLPVVAEPEQTVEPATVEPLAAETSQPVAIEADAGTQAPAPVQVEAPAPPAGSAEAPQIAEIPVGIAQREASLDLSSIIIIDPDIPVPDDFGEMPQIQATPTSGMPPMYPPPYARASPAAVNAAVSAVGPAVSRVEPARPRPVPPQTADWRAPSPPRRNRAWAWGVASVLLLVVLLAQTAYFLRDTLVSQLPQTRPLLERMCALLDCTLSLPKSLALLQIVGSDLETDARGRLTLSLTLGNRAGHAQAWPVLVLTLTDQRNRPLARRSFAPSEYLGDPRRIAAGMPPRSEQPLSLPLTVHDLKPMGFDLQLVY